MRMEKTNTNRTGGSAPRLLCMGAGPKSIATAVQARVLADLGIADVDVVLIEPNGVGANWSGATGFTDGDFPLDTSPLKDVGFPYQTRYGYSVDQALGRYSFIEYLKHVGLFPEWVSRGCGKVGHGVFAQYLGWVADEADIRIERASIETIVPSADGVRVLIRRGTDSEVLEADGILVTGPGLPRRIPTLGANGNSPVLDAQSYWANRDRIAKLPGTPRIAVIGGGQSAGTVGKSVRRTHPDSQVVMVTRSGFLREQSAGYFENQMCSIVDNGWTSLSREERIEFLSRTNNGVIDSGIKAELDQDANVSMLRGRVSSIGVTGESVRLDLACGGVAEVDAAVVATGFDPVAGLERLLPDEVARSEWFSELRETLDVDESFRLPGPGRSIHMASISGISQGPGFPLLSCLGSVAERVLHPYIDTDMDTNEEVNR